jgi:hypothetical protein
MQLFGDDFEPIQAEFRTAAKAACNYTKRPEVKAHQPKPAWTEPGLGGWGTRAAI